jgi:hypothetical protein
MTIAKHCSSIAVFVIIALFTWSPTAFASCVGDIIYQVDYFDGNGLVEETESFLDCENPFNADSPAPFTYQLTLSGQTVSDSSVIEVTEAESVSGSFMISKMGNASRDPLQIFLREGDDYRQLVVARNEDFEISSLQEGEYVAVLQYETLFLQVEAEPFWKRLIDTLFLPTAAYAFFQDSTEVVAIPFTVEYDAVEPEPAGASSVLFLPGIQASRLYTDGLLGSENRLWEPNRNEDVRKLALTTEGESINTVYTADVLDELFSIDNVYKSFLKLLEDMEEDRLINEFVPFAYDWRYDVFTVASTPVLYPEGEEKSLIVEIKRLADASFTGKVTIIAHSNGGLVAKALLHQYGEGELAGLVDKVVMVGTPQLGTPKAIGSLLHGLDQSSPIGIWLNAGVVRDITLNMPGAYGLLPSSKYFAKYASDMITADDSELARPVSSYGDLDSYQNFIDFLLDTKSERNEVVNLTQPVTLRENLLGNTLAQQAILDQWTAPADVEVYEVVGTGNPTIDGFRYKEFKCGENPHCILKPFLKVVPTFTVEGDGTVVLNSAAAYEGDGTRFIVNLPEETFFSPKTHVDLTESESVQTFLQSVVKYPYLTDGLVATEFANLQSQYTILGVHSPVSITVQDESGHMTGTLNGEIKQDIDNSFYFEFAGSKYVIMPKEESVSVQLLGEADGRYSLTIESLGIDGQMLLQEIIGATTTNKLIATFDCNQSGCGGVNADYDGDEEIDAELGWTGEYQSLQPAIGQIEEEILPSIASQSSATRVSGRQTPAGIVAGISTQTDQSELEILWLLLLEIEKMIQELNVYYNLN